MSETMQLSQICPKLEQLRLKRSFVDLNIFGIDGTRVCAHKVVLAAQWPNIEHILNNTHNGELSWAKYPSSIIGAAVHFAYTGEIHLDVSNAMRIYLLALNVGSAALQQLCIDFFLPRITRKNLKHTWSIALGTGSTLLKSSCISVMRRHFEGFVGSSLFLKLDLETIKVMLNTFNFPGKPEESKLQAIVAWIDNRKNRLLHLPELSSFVFQNESTDSTANDIFSVVQDKGNEERLRIVQLDPERNEVTSVEEIPYLRDPSVFVSCGNSIFWLGDWNCSGLVHQFVLVTRTTRTPTQLEKPVRWTASATSGHEIIVSGGENKSLQTVATCSVYAPATNRWTSLRQLRQARMWHRMCWLSDGLVFSIGGFYDRELSSVEMLERAWIPAPKEEASLKWTNVASMKTGRHDFGCCVVEGRIVVAGGGTVGYKPSSSVESFEPPTPTNIGQWTSLTNLASDVSWCFLIPSAAGLLLIDRDGEMQLGRRKAQAASSSEWTWEPRPRLTSFEFCRGLVSLPSTAGASQR